MRRRCSRSLGAYLTLGTADGSGPVEGQQAGGAVDVGTQQHAREVTLHIVLWRGEREKRTGGVEKRE